MKKLLLIAGLILLPACDPVDQPPIENEGRHNDQPYNDGTPR